MLRHLNNLFTPADFPDLLVGLDSPDDAAVWRLDDARALVATTDFFTPVVDNAYDYGAIAAANALSDVYAMGGKPFMALNIVAIPGSLPPEITQQILRGGADKARQAGVVIAGGHTIQDEEPKYGLVVMGMVDPAKMLTKSGARPGDHLLISKPLGFGVTTTALKRQVAEPEDVDLVVSWMTRLNREASQAAVESGLCAATDITGYSLLGHALEMANASRVGFKFIFEKIPFIKCARSYGEMFTFPGGAMDNRSYFGSQVKFSESIDDINQLLLFDPQTSGGLLIAVPAEKIDAVQSRAAEMECSLWDIGAVVEGSGIEVV